MKVAIIGSRSVTDYGILLEAIEESGFDITTVVSGGAKGVDTLAIQYANSRNIRAVVLPADWNNLTVPNAVVKYNTYGKPYNAKAGFDQNLMVIEMSDAVIAVQKDKSSGTQNTIDLARKKGIPVFVKEVTDNQISPNCGKTNSRNNKYAVDWAKRIRDDKNAIVIDTESTGGSHSEVISIGIVRAYNGEVLYNSLIKPSEEAEFNYYATEVHGITPDYLINSPTLKQEWKELFPLLHKNKVVAYNSSSDKRIIEFSAGTNKLKLPEIDWYCVMKAYKSYTLRNRNVTLTKACEELNAKPGHHDALGDALAAARILYAIATEMKPNIKD